MGSSLQGHYFPQKSHQQPFLFPFLSHHQINFIKYTNMLDVYLPLHFPLCDIIWTGKRKNFGKIKGDDGTMWSSVRKSIHKECTCNVVLKHKIYVLFCGSHFPLGKMNFTFEPFLWSFFLFQQRMRKSGETVTLRYLTPKKMTFYLILDNDEYNLFFSAKGKVI